MVGNAFRLVVAAFLSFMVLPAAPPSEFVQVPAGRFLMGSPRGEEGRSAGEVRHAVRISAFRLARFPVTQKAWEAVMDVNPSSFRGNLQLPVEGVTWYSAIAYCNLRSIKEGLEPCYRYEDSGTDPRRWPAGWNRANHDRIHCDWTANGYRLPTEAEWEYASRAGTSTATAFGDRLTSRQANFNGEAPYGTREEGPNLQRTTPVGSYPPNAWGLYDMHGNIAEWCWDGFAPYPTTPQTDPRGPSGLVPHRVHRGGSWFNHGVDVRSAARSSDTPHFRLDMLPGGFRLARGAAP